MAKHLLDWQHSVGLCHATVLLCERTIQEQALKVKTAVRRVWEPIQWTNAWASAADRRAAAELAAERLKKYQRRFGRRHFGQYLRMCVRNALWETGATE